MNSLNEKIKSSFDDNQDRALVAGQYGWNTTAGKWNKVQVNNAGEMKVDLSIDESTLATSAKQDTIIANQTNSTQKTQVLGNTQGNGSGDSHHLHVDANGNAKTIVVSTVNVAPANNTNSGTTDDPTNSVACGIKGREDPSLASTEHFIRVDSNGRLSVDINSGIPTKTDGSAGHSPATGIGLIGFEGSTARAISTDADGHLQVDVLSGGGGGTQYVAGTTGMATGTGTLQIGNYAGSAKPIQVSSSGNQFVELADFQKGQVNMANSFPVVISSDQSRLPTNSSQDEVVITQSAVGVTNGNTFNSTAVDLRGYKRISFFGNTSNSTDPIYVLFSADDTTYYRSGEIIVQDFNTGDYSYNNEVGARYLKLQQGTTQSGAGFTITCISSKK